MGKIVKTEKYQRGLFGWIFQIMFIAFNCLMFAIVVVMWIGVSQITPDPSDTQHLNYAIAVSGTMALSVPWLLGNIILGLLVHFTSGRKVILREELP